MGFTHHGSSSSIARPRQRTRRCTDGSNGRHHQGCPAAERARAAREHRTRGLVESLQARLCQITKSPARAPWMRRLAPSPAEGRSLVPPHAPTAQQQIIASQATRAQATTHPATSTDAHSASHLLSLSLSPQGTRWRARVPPTPRVFHRVALVRHDERQRARDEGPAVGPHKVTESERANGCPRARRATCVRAV